MTMGYSGRRDSRCGRDEEMNEGNSTADAEFEGNMVHSAGARLDHNNGPSELQVQ